MPDISSKVKSLIESVRSKLTRTPSERPLDQRRRGYQLYAQEQKAMGESAEDYDTWLSKQSPEM
jgi:hypothetical protein